MFPNVFHNQPQQEETRGRNGVEETGNSLKKPTKFGGVLRSRNSDSKYCNFLSSEVF